MAGSDKLYLEPILKALLDGLNASMQSIDGIVDGLGEAVAEMKSAVDVVSGTVDTVSDTLTTTNTKLEQVNNSVGETAELVVYPAAISGKTPVETLNKTLWNNDQHRYERSYGSQDIITLESFADGGFTLNLSLKGGSGVSSSNPGVKLIDQVSGQEVVLIDNAPVNQAQKSVIVPVAKGHSYKLQAYWDSGAGDYDLFIYSLGISGAVYKLGAMAAYVINATEG